jgi:hypothetical protein
MADRTLLVYRTLAPSSMGAVRGVQSEIQARYPNFRLAKMLHVSLLHLNMDFDNDHRKTKQVVHLLGHSNFDEPTLAQCQNSTYIGTRLGRRKLALDLASDELEDQADMLYKLAKKDQFNVRRRGSLHLTLGAIDSDHALDAIPHFTDGIKPADLTFAGVSFVTTDRTSLRKLKALREATRDSSLAATDPFYQRGYVPPANVTITTVRPGTFPAGFLDSLRPETGAQGQE